MNCVVGEGRTVVSCYQCTRQPAEGRQWSVEWESSGLFDLSAWKALGSILLLLVFSYILNFSNRGLHFVLSEKWK